MLSAVPREPNGVRYEGEFEKGMKHGRGPAPTATVCYSHWEIFFCILCIAGVLIMPDNTRYEGMFYHNVPEGQGVYTQANGSRYEVHAQKHTTTATAATKAQ